MSSSDSIFTSFGLKSLTTNASLGESERNRRGGEESELRSNIVQVNAKALANASEELLGLQRHCTFDRCDH